MKNRSHGTREEDMEQMIVSICLSAFLSVTLCSVLPSITKENFIGFFFGFWVTGTMVIWTIIDLIVRKMEDQ